jgi:hypothetical protein
MEHLTARNQLLTEKKKKIYLKKLSSIFFTFLLLLSSGTPLTSATVTTVLTPAKVVPLDFLPGPWIHLITTHLLIAKHAPKDTWDCRRQ